MSKEEGGRRKEGGRKEEGGRRKEEGMRKGKALVSAAALPLCLCRRFAVLLSLPPPCLFVPAAAVSACCLSTLPPLCCLNLDADWSRQDDRDFLRNPPHATWPDATPSTFT